MLMLDGHNVIEVHVFYRGIDSKQTVIVHTVLESQMNEAICFIV